MFIETTSLTLRSNHLWFANLLCLSVILLGINHSLLAQYQQSGNKTIPSDLSPLAAFGKSVALSSDGNTALVGGPDESSQHGAIWFFTKSGSSWIQHGKKTVGTGSSDSAQLGLSLALSANGKTAIVGAPNDTKGTGGVWIFVNSGSAWVQQGNKLLGTGSVGKSLQGASVALSEDGNTALVGGPKDNGGVGAMWVFTRTGTNWVQEGNKIIPKGNTGLCAFGHAVAISANGNVAMSGGPNNDTNKGAVWTITRNNKIWTQQEYKLVPTSPEGASAFGNSLSLSGDGNTVLIGGTGDNDYAGAAWVFSRTTDIWPSHGKKLTGTGMIGKGGFGLGVALSTDGQSAAIGAYSDSANYGAVLVFKKFGNNWYQYGNKLVGKGGSAPLYLGRSLDMSATGETIITGGHGDLQRKGAFWTFSKSLDLKANLLTISPSAILSGDSITVSHTIKNLSKQNAALSYLSYYVSADSVLDISDVLLGKEKQLDPLTSGQEKTISAKFKITLPVNNYFLLIVNKPDLNTKDLNPLYTIGKEKFYITKPDLIISSYTPILPLLPEDSIPIKCTVKNIGMARSNALCELQYYLSRDITLDTNDISLSGIITIGTLSAGGTIEINIKKYEIPPVATANDYYVLIYIDKSDKISETDENNNVANIPIKINAAPDWNTKSMMINTKQIYADDTVSFYCYFTNKGGNSEGGLLQYFLSKDSIFDANDVPLHKGHVLNNTLKPQVVYHFNKEIFKIPPTTLSGINYIITYIDKNNEVNESNEKNNIFAQKIIVLPRPVIDTVIYSKFFEAKMPIPFYPSIISESEIISMAASYRKITDTTIIETQVIKNKPFNFSIPANFADDPIGIELNIVAIDTFGNKSKPYKDSIYIYWADRGLPIPYEHFGEEEKNYRIISFPAVLDQDSIEKIFEKSLGVYNKEKWRLFSYYNGSNIEYNNGLSIIEPGKGYWFICKDKPSLPFATGAGHTVSVTGKNPFKLDLQKGWNLIGNPYYFNISWDEIKKYSKNDSASLISWKKWEGQWSSDPSLTKMEGAFILADKPTTLYFPNQIKNLSAKRNGNTVHANNKNNWELPIILKEGKNRYLLGGIGMNEKASISKDEMDDFTPPPFGDWLEINFYHHEYFYPKFTKDIVPIAPAFIWEMEVNGKNSGIRTLEWDTTLFSAQKKQLYLHDESTESLINMSVQDSYTFELNHPNFFKIYYGNASFIENNLQAKKITLGNTTLNPSTGTLKVPVTLPSSSEEYHIEMIIFNDLGQAVHSIASGWYKPGFHEFIWEVKNNQTTTNGRLYVLKLMVTEKQNTKSFFQKILL